MLELIDELPVVVEKSDAIVTYKINSENNYYKVNNNFVDNRILDYGVTTVSNMPFINLMDILNSISKYELIQLDNYFYIALIHLTDTIKYSCKFSSTDICFRFHEDMNYNNYFFSINLPDFNLLNKNIILEAMVDSYKKHFDNFVVREKNFKIMSFLDGLSCAVTYSNDKINRF